MTRATDTSWAGPVRAEVEIPGTVTAVYNFETGALDCITFTPHAGAAGHFGASAFVGDTYDDEGPIVGVDHDTIEHALDVDNVDGRFWEATQAAIQDPQSAQGSDALHYCIGWTE